MMANPAVQQMTQQLMANPALMQGMIESDPTLRALCDANPQLRTILSDPAMIRRAADPANMQAVLQLQQSGLLPGLGLGAGAGAGAASANPWAAMFGAASSPAPAPATGTGTG